MPQIKQDATSDPLWYKDAVIYQIHIKSFFDSNADGYGDFPGLIEKLDYVQDLGANCIWLLPFYPSPLRDDGYDISDYEGINPVYGNRENFQTFISEAHRRGIRVITELVVNHTSDQHPWFQASRQAPPGSNKRNYYVWSDSDRKYTGVRVIFCDTEKSNWTWDPVAKAYYWHRFFHHQPDLNFDNPSVLKAVIRVMRFWLDLGVDGLRLDGIPYLIEREGTNCENLPETHEILKEFRRVMDENYDGRIFLAEACQWPSDVVKYFGNGDECHMAFHFPVMPRLYMAIHQEDRHPITEIMAQTPAIPDNCQWAVFLRNHDELTLEMVSDEERDYMYKAYAEDPMMRLNVGIRRRLAPLMQYSRPRIELMNALLLSLPGTPIVYYGDEIGMGENIFLGDRNGVRTPMQWNSDRNAGFSRAPFAKLYSAPIMDPVTGYPAVNVESQQLDPSSLLHWMKTIIGLRKRYKAFGRGSFEPVESDNRKVLSYLRRYENETILMVANLSRYPQSVALNLRQFQSIEPTELLGLGKFHAIGEHPYILTLGPYSFYWLGIALPEEAVLVTTPPATGDTKTQTRQLPVREAVVAVGSNLRQNWQALMKSQLPWQLEAYVLPAYLHKQRWFGGKAKTIESVAIKDWVSITESPELTSIVFAQVDYDDETRELYSFFLAVAEGERAVQLLNENPASVIAELTGAGEDRAVIYDALESEDFCLALFKLIEHSEKRKTQAGDLDATKMPEFDSLIKEADQHSIAVRRIATEQSNSSIVFGSSFILKLFRNLQPGENPDYELGKYLTQVRHFKSVPQIAGAIEYGGKTAGDRYVVGLAQELVWSQGDAWTYTVEEFRRFYERALTHMYVVDKIDPGQARMADLIEKDIPQEAYELLAIYLREASILGKRTAEMHVALSQDTDDPSIRPEPMTKEDLTSLKEEMHADIDEILSQLKARYSALPPDMVEPAQELSQFRSSMLEVIDTIDEVNTQLLKMRCHGDYHLGQVLYRAGDFVILDFEGEPAKSLAHRRRKLSPMKDIAGMVRSFSYAAWAGLFLFLHNRPEELERFMPWAKICQTWVSVSFLKGYLETAAGHDFIPDSRTDFFRVLLPFIMDKAMYEIKYELNNRPDWLKVPVSGILQYLRANTLNSEAASPK